MRRWHVCQDEDTHVWVSSPQNTLEALIGLESPSWYFFPTWRQAYQYALTRARQESAQDDWTPEPVPMSGRDALARQNQTVNR